MAPTASLFSGLMHLRFDFRVWKLLDCAVSSEGFPSGQREQTVNLPALPSKVRILPPPPVGKPGISGRQPATKQRDRAVGLQRWGSLGERRGRQGGARP